MLLFHQKGNCGWEPALPAFMFLTLLQINLFKTFEMTGWIHSVFAVIILFRFFLIRQEISGAVAMEMEVVMPGQKIFFFPAIFPKKKCSNGMEIITLVG